MYSLMTIANANPPGNNIYAVVLTPFPKESKNPDFVSAPGNGPSRKNAMMSKVVNMVGVR